MRTPLKSTIFIVYIIAMVLTLELFVAAQADARPISYFDDIKVKYLDYQNEEHLYTNENLGKFPMYFQDGNKLYRFGKWTEIENNGITSYDFYPDRIVPKYTFQNESQLMHYRVGNSSNIFIEASWDASNIKSISDDKIDMDVFKRTTTINGMDANGQSINLTSSVVGKKIRFNFKDVNFSNITYPLILTEQTITIDNATTSGWTSNVTLDNMSIVNGNVGLDMIEWSQVYYDLQNTGKTPYPSNSLGIFGNNYPAGTNGVSSQPTYDIFGNIYFVDYGNYIVSLYPNFTLRWNVTYGQALLGNGIVIDDVNGVGWIVHSGIQSFYLNNGTFACNYGDGEEDWDSVTKLYNNTLYVGSYNTNRTLGIDTATCSKKWEYNASNLATGSQINWTTGFTLDVTNDSAYFGSYKSLYALYLNGSFKWVYNTTDVVGVSAVGSDGKIYFSVIYPPEEGNDKFWLYALYPNGTLAWFTLTGWHGFYGLGGSTPAIDNSLGVVYINTASNGHVLGYWMNNGTLKVSINTSVQASIPPIAIDSNSNLFFVQTEEAPGSSKLYSYTPSGTQRWNYSNNSFRFKTNSMLSINNNGSIVAGTNNSLFSTDSSQSGWYKTVGNLVILNQTASAGKIISAVRFNVPYLNSLNNTANISARQNGTSTWTQVSTNYLNWTWVNFSGWAQTDILFEGFGNGSARMFLVSGEIDEEALAIIDYNPSSDPSASQNTAQAFNITLNHNANVTWLVDGVTVQTNTSLTLANYTNNGSTAGTFNITVSATDGVDTVSRMWNLTVTAPAQESTSTSSSTGGTSGGYTPEGIEEIEESRSLGRKDYSFRIIFDGSDGQVELPKSSEHGITALNLFFKAPVKGTYTFILSTYTDYKPRLNGSLKYFSISPTFDLKPTSSIELTSEEAIELYQLYGETWKKLPKGAKVSKGKYRFPISSIGVFAVKQVSKQEITANTVQAKNGIFSINLPQVDLSQVFNNIQQKDREAYEMLKARLAWLVDAVERVKGLIGGKTNTLS